MDSPVALLQSSLGSSFQQAPTLSEQTAQAGTFRQETAESYSYYCQKAIDSEKIANTAYLTTKLPLPSNTNRKHLKIKLEKSYPGLEGWLSC